MTNPPEAPTLLHPVSEPGQASAWEQQWARVPTLWRAGVFDISQEPFSELFMQLATRGTVFDVRPQGFGRAGQEICWWMFISWSEGFRRIDPFLLRAYARAVESLLGRQLLLTGQPAQSITGLPAGLIAREADRLFEARYGRLPGKIRRRHVRELADNVALLLQVRCSGRDWWRSDVWDLTADPRNPRRPHEPYGDTTVRLEPIEPAWLREGVRFWMSYALTYDLYTWTSVITRARHLPPYFSRFLIEHGISSPLLVDDPTQLRPLMMRLLSWLRSPSALAAGRTVPVGATTVASTQSILTKFYEFMIDNRAEAAAFTGDPRWLQLNADYTRLWPPQFRVSTNSRSRSGRASFMSRADLDQMICCLPILAGPRDEPVTVTLPGGRSITSNGMGDPQAMRAWLLQAMTGRRASEILLLDFDPIQPLHPTAGEAEPAQDAFVARLRYQQTKVEGVDPTILIEQAVVNLIRDQQQWVETHLGHRPAYLFVSLRGNHRGLRPRLYNASFQTLHRLDGIVNLTDEAGQPLRFTQSHRLRHTRATELLNAGVAIHIVQRYLGHRSPEMTMRYADTLASVAEAEFLRYKKIGSDGNDLAIDPHDLYDMAQLDRRTDRILPNGYCMLPPAKSCDRGNACLTCTHYATDATFIDGLHDQHQQTLQLIQQRQAAFTARHGAPMSAEHVWLAERTREIDAITTIIRRLTDDSTDTAVRAAGVNPGRVLPIRPVTSGAHHATLDAPQHRP